MARSEFSETQFVFGYLKEIFFQYRMAGGVMPFWYFHFPSAVEEQLIPADFFIDHYSHSEYYQFKRSECIGVGRGRKPTLHPSLATYLPCYRFKIYNDTKNGLGQFEKLKQLAFNFPNDKVFYCAPCFHTEFEFLDKFHRNCVVSDSVLVDCGQFNSAAYTTFNINDGDDHFFYFQSTGMTGYLCSEPFKIKLERGQQVATKEFSGQNLESYVNTLFEKIYLADFSQNNSLFQEAPQYPNTLTQKIGVIRDHLIGRFGIIWQPIFSLRT